MEKNRKGFLCPHSHYIFSIYWEKNILTTTFKDNSVYEYYGVEEDVYLHLENIRKSLGPVGSGFYKLVKQAGFDYEKIK